MNKNIKNIGLIMAAVAVVAVTSSGCSTYGNRGTMAPPTTPAIASVPAAQEDMSSSMHGIQVVLPSNAQAQATQTGVVPPVVISFDTVKWTGMIGGSPCLIGNHRTDKITMEVLVTNDGSSFTVDLSPGTNRVYNILPGSYSYTYRDDKGRQEQAQQPRKLTVYGTPCQTIDGEGSYHAVVIFMP